jgi:pimeloyl-ACP methyl ester carboxylesterase
MSAAHTVADAPVRMHSLGWGRRGSPRVLLIHGVQSAATTWWQIAHGLAAAGYAVEAPDLRGHGSSPGAVRYRLADFASDLEQLEPGFELVVGHSLGGTLAAYLLARAPAFAKRAVLLDPVLELAANELEPIVAAQLAELWTADADAIQRANPAWHPEDCRLKASAAAACSPAAAEAVLRDNWPWDYRASLDAVDTPVLVLGGDPARGAMLAPTLGESLAAGNANIRYRRLASAGHSLHRDEPDLVLAAIVEMLGKGEA